MSIWDIAVACASKVVEYLVPPIGRQIGYIWNYNSNFDDLKKDIEQLENKRVMVQRSVDTAGKQGEEIEQFVSVWLDNATKMIVEASTVVGEKEQGNTKCFKGLCPNPNKRYQYGRKAAKKVKAVAELCRQGQFNFTKVSYETSPKEIWIPSHIGYEAFESRESTLKEIRKALEDADINMIGVHGSGGIGKTTLVRKAADYAENSKLFNVVAFAEVGEKPDIGKIQQKIAFSLGLKFNMESPDERAMKLQARLKKENKVLLVLDNIWEKLRLEKVGIPFGDDHKGCKVLLTARDLNALTLTGSAHNFSMDVLKDHEAWTLFRTKVGDCVEQSDELKNLAERVAIACGGLLIAIVTIAEALKNKAVFEWRNALQELEKPSSSTLNGVAGKTCSCIEFSYNQLKDEELKAIFLLCCAMKSTYDASVRDLVIYVWGLGLFKSADRIEEVRDRVRTLLQRLTDASLLLDTPDNESFSMHDVVRDVGRLIASRNQHVVEVMNDNIGRDWYDDDALKTSTRIFLNNVIELPEELPEELRCPNLQLLYIKGTYALTIPDRFFTGMPKIRVLHLSDFHLSSLPTSLCQLVDLRALRMDRCKVKDMALIGKLRRLESLSIADYHGIKRLPEGICELTRLRFLDVKRCFNLEDIPPNVISRLTQLEELYLGYTSIQWEDQDGSNVLSKGLFSKKLERYDVNIGETIQKYRFRSFWMPHEKKSRRLKLNRFRDVHHKMHSVKKVVSALDGGEGFPNLKQLYVEDSSFFDTVGDCSELNSCDPFPYLETLILDKLNKLETIYNGQLGAKNLCHLVRIQVFNCPKLKNVFSFSTSGAPLLREIEVCDCENMTEIFAIGREEDIIQLKELRSLTLESLPQLTSFCSINDNKVIAEDKRDTPTPFFNVTVAFPKIERITISSVKNLEMICDNQVAKDSFTRLKSVKILNCRSLKSLFPASIAKELSLLEELNVSECGQLGEIVVKEGEIVVKEGAGVEEITNLGGQNFRLISQAHIPEHLIAKLKSLKVSHDKSAVFPPDILWRFLNLEKLQLKDSSYEEVFSLEEIEKHGEKLAQIKSLELQGLGSLKHIGKQHSKLDFILQKLEKLKVSGCGLADLLPSSASFQSLKILRVKGCNNLTHILTSSRAKSLVQLTEMEISRCNELTKVVARDEGDITKYKVIFHKLNTLILEDLSSLTNFCLEEYDFEFPSLKDLSVLGCSKMESFSPGCLSTPKLNRVNGGDIIWEGDIDTVIQQKYKKQSDCIFVYNMPC